MRLNTLVKSRNVKVENFEEVEKGLKANFRDSLGLTKKSARQPRDFRFLVDPALILMLMDSFVPCGNRMATSFIYCNMKRKF